MGTNPRIIAYPAERLPALIWSDNGHSGEQYYPDMSTLLVVFSLYTFNISFSVVNIFTWIGLSFTAWIVHLLGPSFEADSALSVRENPHPKSAWSDIQDWYTSHQNCTFSFGGHSDFLKLGFVAARTEVPWELASGLPRPYGSNGNFPWPARNSPRRGGRLDSSYLCLF